MERKINACIIALAVIAAIVATGLIARYAMHGLSFIGLS